MAKKYWSIYIDDAVLEAVKERAEKLGISMNKLIMLFVEQGLYEGYGTKGPEVN
jgi:antitoxin component of RelBE/YafQ-DinJ toxin-antitoxin module